jgi:hypothetical protein
MALSLIIETKTSETVTHSVVAIARPIGKDSFSSVQSETE